MGIYETGIALLQDCQGSPEDTGKLMVGARLLMHAYNENPSEELYRRLESFLLLPNERAMMMNFAKFRDAVSRKDKYLPEYGMLPVRVFPVTSDYSVIFDVEHRKFLMDSAGDPMWELYRAMMMDQFSIKEIEEGIKKQRNAQRASELLEIFHRAEERRDWPRETRELLDEFYEKGNDPAAYYFFLGCLAFQQGRCKEAFSHAFRAYRLRKANQKIWELLERLEQELHGCNSMEKGCYAFHVACFPEENETHETIQSRFRYKIPIEAVDVQLAPFYCKADNVAENHDVRLHNGCGEFLVHQRNSREEHRYWCGAYNPHSFMWIRQYWMQVFENNRVPDPKLYSNLFFDVMKVQEAKELKVRVPEGRACVLALAGSGEGKYTTQELCIMDAEEEGSVQLSKGEFRFLRLTKDTTFSSGLEFVASAPVLLEHAPHRKRLVLNILLDGLAWSQMQKDDFAHVPNLVKFFSKGIIFNNAYAVAEYTYPSLATIDTGLHMHRSQIFHDKIFVSLGKEHRTLSELAKEKGYYCVNLMGDARGIYNGVQRGFDRLIVAPYLEMLAYKGVQRVIEHLDAFYECDNYLFLHVSDPHPFPWNTPAPLRSQVQLHWKGFDLAEKSSDAGTHDIHLDNYEIYKENNLYMIQRMDQELARLFKYIEDHYQENEYVVNAYSDHGTSIYEKGWLLREERSKIAMMARGTGIPKLGMVNELASVMDEYAIVAKELGIPVDQNTVDANLPEVFGGKKREFVITNSIFPGQTYKLCIRTELYEFQLETDAMTREDGTVDMSSFSYRLYARDERHSEVYSDSVKDYFLGIAYEHTKSFAHSDG